MCEGEEEGGRRGSEGVVACVCECVWGGPLTFGAQKNAVASLLYLLATCLPSAPLSAVFVIVFFQQHIQNKVWCCCFVSGPSCHCSSRPDRVLGFQFCRLVVRLLGACLTHQRSAPEQRGRTETLAACSSTSVRMVKHRQTLRKFMHNV
eukprot:350867-Chlamydomonas_euryale.AAC.2